MFSTLPLLINCGGVIPGVLCFTCTPVVCATAWQQLPPQPRHPHGRFLVLSSRSFIFLFHNPCEGEIRSEIASSRDYILHTCCPDGVTLLITGTLVYPPLRLGLVRGRMPLNYDVQVCERWSQVMPTQTKNNLLLVCGCWFIFAPAEQLHVTRTSH